MPVKKQPHIKLQMIKRKTMKKTSKKVTKKATSKSSSKSKTKSDSKPETEDYKTNVKAKINEFVNSDKFDKVLDFFQAVSGKEDAELSEKIKSKVTDLKVDEFFENLEATVKHVEARGKKIVEEINEMLKKNR